MNATSLIASLVALPPTFRRTIASLRSRPRKCAGSTRGSRQVITSRRRLGKTTAPWWPRRAAKARLRASAVSIPVGCVTSAWLKVFRLPLIRTGSAELGRDGEPARWFCLRRVLGAGFRLGGQQRQGHHGARSRDAGCDVVRGVEAVEEGGAGDVVDGRRELGVTVVGQLTRGGERRADGVVRGALDAVRQGRGQAARQAARVERREHAADDGDPKCAAQQPGGVVYGRADAG